MIDISVINQKLNIEYIFESALSNDEFMESHIIYS